MEKKEKLEILRKLDEKRLRQEVLIPLFQKMGFKDVIEYHGGPAEKGKDIIYYETDRYGDKDYTGVVVKKDDISGSVSDSSGAMTVLNQIQQTFNEPYTDIYGLKKLVINRCIVITSGNIKNTAVESITGTLERFNMDKLVKFFDGSKLVELLDTHMPDYFFKELACFNAYFNAMKDDFQAIRDISAIGQKEPVLLEDLYVSLKLSETSREREMPFDMEKEVELKIFDGKEMERKAKVMKRRERVLDVDAAVRSFHRMVVVGAPGAGKTTLLKHLALKSCKTNIEKQERLTVPVPITLREFIREGMGLRNYIDKVFEKYCFPEAKDSVEKDLKSGKCMLLLDGFDELATRENQVRVAEEIHRFVEQYQRCRVLVTSRIAGYHDELTGFTRLELMEFDENQVKQFIHNWFGKDEPKKAQSMLKAVKGNQNIRNMAKNPLMLAIIAIIYEEDRELPQRRADLYKRAVDVLLRKWDLRKKLKNRFSVEQKEFILRKLAFRCHCRNQRTISEMEILKEISRHSTRLGLKKEETKSILEEIWQRSYILRQISMDTYDFLHLSFQEYFTALEIKEQEDGVGTIIQHISEPWWEEPIMLFAGISRDAEPLIKRIQKEVPEDILLSNLMLSGKCIADAEFTNPDLKEEIVQRLWQLHNDSEFIFIRGRAMGVLRRLKPQSITDLLLYRLKDSDSSVRKSAANTLGAMGSPEALPVLLDALRNDEDSEVRGRAANALGDIGSPEAMPPLLEVLRTDTDFTIRGLAAEALGVMGSPEAMPTLLEALRSNSDFQVRESAASALGYMGSPEAMPTLVEALRSDSDSSVRARAAEALGAMGSPEAMPPLLEALRSDTDSDVRVSAASALGAMGSPEAMPFLLKALRSDTDSFDRFCAAYGLGAMSSPEALPPLLEALCSDSDSFVRWCVANALGAIGSPEALPPLLKALRSDEDFFVRWRAAEALGKIGDDTAIQPLEEALEDDGEYAGMKVKDKAFEALEKISRRTGKRILSRK
ncbi:MAG: NACHT domain-containing protein [Candidatus Aminicenantes bacterium]|nr:NACHT domain-containing protein [Candidatus Aminicenantes bacterium]NIM80938.1 NACHT domain-containing protein [Candidatus Aminicenantes bacterium]NIN20320.1 NACHT domain-containing protein [Candidatus Aminicenantes bacterium]NIN44095.1 NACHT domain-containing protein [Candidatus Aminicenantes bacterium]NIN86907.1 NACHT domain-containing protein [Candidatus Aminicenantes bacterium]